MKQYLHKHRRILFYSAWLAASLLQARFTELLDDEAYYWVYSRFPAWGYFDHPPMIALMIKAGYTLFHNELGVRLLSVGTNLLTLLVIEKLLSNRNQVLFFVIVSSVAVLQLGGFLAVPDAPLIFFTALFFYAYQRFRQRLSPQNTFLLGIVSLLLLYSKYHGVLILLLTLLSDLSLLRKRQTYLAALIVFAGFLPHLFWQYGHGWPSLHYHLLERNAPAYDVRFTLDYLLGQLLLPGPIAGFLLLPVALSRKPADGFERALLFSMVGFYAFFFLSTYRGYVEANWTAPVIVPLVVLSHNALLQKKRLRQWLAGQLPFTLLLILVARAALVADLFQLDFIKTRYHAWSGWPQVMKEKTRGLPVVFNGSYQRASKYWFYTGQEAYAPTFYRERRSNYDFWPIEDSLLGKPVFVLDVYNLPQFPDSLQTPIGWVGYRFDSAFHSFAKVEIKCTEETISLKEGEPLVLHCTSAMPALYADYITTHKNLPSTVVIGLFDKNGWIKDIPLSVTLADVLKPFAVKVPVSIPKGKYYLLFSIQAGKNVSTHNSGRIEVTVQ